MLAASPNVVLSPTRSLADALCSGHVRFAELDLGKNGISDASLVYLAGAMRQSGGCVRRLSLLRNSVADAGALALSLLIADSPDSSPEWISLSSNNIGAGGLLALFSVCDAPRLRSLDLSSQTSDVEPQLVEQALGALVDALGRRSAENPLEYLDVTGFVSGGNQKSLWANTVHKDHFSLLDCAAIRTDFSFTRRTPGLCLSDALSFLQCSKRCALNDAEFETIVGNGPPWLFVPELRRRAVFISHLSAHVTIAKLEVPKAAPGNLVLRACSMSMNSTVLGLPS